AVLSGAKSATATDYGSVFGPVPSDQPAFAFDRDPHTAWLAGGLGSAVGQAITITCNHPTQISTRTLRPVLGAKRQISSVQVRAGASVFSAPIPSGRTEVKINFPAPTTTSSLTLTVTGIRGAGVNPVG